MPGLFLFRKGAPVTGLTLELEQNLIRDGLHGRHFLIFVI